MQRLCITCSVVVRHFTRLIICMLIEVCYSFAVKFHVDRYKRRFKKISSTEGDKLKYFGGELLKVGAGACFTTGNELKDVLGTNWQWSEISSSRLTRF